MRVVETVRATMESLVSLRRLRGDEEDGAALAEYAFLLALVAVIAAPVLATIGPKVAAMYTSAAGAFG